MKISLYPIIDAQSQKQTLFFSKKDLVFNFHHWESATIPFLFITGLAGSGKTTLGQQLASQYNCPLISLDNITRFEHPQEGIIDTKKVNKYFFYNKLFEFIQWELDEYQSRCIIEGVQCLFFDKSTLFNYPVLIKRTALIQSSWNASKRIFFSQAYNYIPKVWKDNLTFLTYQKSLLSYCMNRTNGLINVITYI